jgi:hypothetical protein
MVTMHIMLIVAFVCCVQASGLVEEAGSTGTKPSIYDSGWCAGAACIQVVAAQQPAGCEASCQVQSQALLHVLCCVVPMQAC